MSEPIPGIHHITAIATDPQRNVDFYVRLLGLRLVKRTVNFDDPDTYHLYFGDESGRPGTLLTFFPWPGALRGRAGSGEVSATTFEIPAGSLYFWGERLAAHGVTVEGPAPRMGERVLAFEDPDGTRLELVESGAAPAGPRWRAGAVEPRHAIRGFHSATLAVKASGPSAKLLVETLGFRPDASEGARRRYRAAGAGRGAIVDLLEMPEAPRCRLGAGSVHHIAWRTRDEASQVEWRERLVGAGFHPTSVRDRQYFRSIYFREPAGVLFEIATDPPGFTVDEPVEGLGATLRLPPWLESMRGPIERRLPGIQVPEPREVP